MDRVTSFMDEIRESFIDKGIRKIVNNQIDNEFIKIVDIDWDEEASAFQLSLVDGTGILLFPEEKLIYESDR